MAAANTPQVVNKPEDNEKDVKRTAFKLDSNGMVKVTHPKLKGQVGEVVPSSLPAWLARGWTVAEPNEGNDQKFVVTVDAEKNTGEVTPESQK